MNAPVASEGDAKRSTATKAKHKAFHDSAELHRSFVGRLTIVSRRGRRGEDWILVRVSHGPIVA